MYSLPRSSQILWPSPRVMIGTLWPRPPSERSSKTEWRVKCIHRWSRAASLCSVPSGVCVSLDGSKMDRSVVIEYPSCSAAC